MDKGSIIVCKTSEDVMITTLYARAQNIAILKNELVQILIGACMLIVATQISIPLQPVPITMQTVAVLLIGLFYSRATAVKTVLAYLAIGAVGFPVFSNFSGGFVHFLKPTAGYLWGFLGCVYLMAMFREKIKSDTYLTQLLCCILGSIVTYACGISWLALFVGVPGAIKFGLVPFIIPGVVKALFVAYCSKHIKTSHWM